MPVTVPPPMPAALALAVASMGQAVLALAIGVNRLAETAEQFTRWSRPPPWDERR